MAEHSYLWTTGGAGDGASTYTRTDWSNITKIISAVRGMEGVAPSMLNALAGTPGTNKVSIATGAALVDGKPYYLDAGMDVTIPSSTAGNTRIDRVVLRADWTAQTVRLYRIAGVDSGSPTVPAIVQTTGTTYDIKLFQATVTATGTVTINLDERQLSKIAHADILAGSIVDADINTAAAIGIAKLASLVTKRKGNDTDDWSAAGGAGIAYTPTNCKIQVGAYQASYTSTLNKTFQVTFPENFGGPPIIFTAVQSVSNTGSIVMASISTYMDFRATITGTTTDVIFSWLAIGKQ